LQKIIPKIIIIVELKLIIGKNITNDSKCNFIKNIINNM